MKLFTMLALALSLASAPMFGIGGTVDVCTYDNTEIVVLADCTQIEVSPSCWCSADPDTREFVWVGMQVLEEKYDCGIEDPCICDPGAEAVVENTDDLTILAVTPRDGQYPENATPAPKEFAAAACLTCPDDSVWAALFAKKKNNHFDVVIGTDGTEIIRAGINLHTNPCDE